jgi:hypothetical protein
MTTDVIPGAPADNDLGKGPYAIADALRAVRPLPPEVLVQYAEQPSVAAVLEKVPAIADQVARVIYATQADERLTAKGAADARAEALKAPLGELAALETQVEEEEDIDRTVLESAEESAQSALEPESEYGKQKALVMAQRVFASGSSPAERFAALMLMSPEAWRSVLYVGHEIAGLAPSAVPHLRARLGAGPSPAERERFTVRQARRDRARATIRETRAAIIEVSDQVKLARAGLAPMPGRAMSRAELIAHFRDNKAGPAW